MESASNPNIRYLIVLINSSSLGGIELLVVNLDLIQKEDLSKGVTDDDLQTYS